MANSNQQIPPPSSITKRIVKCANISLDVGPKFLVDTKITVEENKDLIKKIENDEEGQADSANDDKTLSIKKVIKKRRVIVHTKEIKKTRTRVRNFPRIIINDTIFDEETGRTYITENYITLLGVNVEEFQLDDTEKSIYEKRFFNGEFYKTKRDIVLEEDPMKIEPFHENIQVPELSQPNPYAQNEGKVQINKEDSELKNVGNLNKNLLPINIGSLPLVPDHSSSL